MFIEHVADMTLENTVYAFQAESRLAYWAGEVTRSLVLHVSPRRWRKLVRKQRAVLELINRE